MEAGTSGAEERVLPVVSSLKFAFPPPVKVLNRSPAIPLADCALSTGDWRFVRRHRNSMSCRRCLLIGRFGKGKRPT